jgi:hypothetical protein
MFGTLCLALTLVISNIGIVTNGGVFFYFFFGNKEHANQVYKLTRTVKNTRKYENRNRLTKEYIVLSNITLQFLSTAQRGSSLWSK